MFTGEIQILPSHKIDKQKWDACIAKSANSFIYATTTYLDNMADNWHGIVIDDYDCVMPVSWRKKSGIRYTHYVPFIQQLGWFTQTVNIDTAKLLKTLHDFIKYGDYNFNYYNNLPAEYAAKPQTNYVLQLTKPLPENTFSKSYVNSLQKARQHLLNYQHSTIDEAIEIFKKNYPAVANQVSSNSFINFSSLCKQLYNSGGCIVRKITSKENNTLSVCLLLKDDKRLYNIINATTEEGRKKESNYLLYAEVFNEFADSNLLFDFEGSDIPGVKSFYQKFNVINQPYYYIHINQLPAILKWLKR